jgi:hypothetical protein
MQDPPIIYPDWQCAAHTARIETQGTVLGEVAAVTLGVGYVSGV